MSTRGSWVYRDGEMVPKHLAAPRPRGPRAHDMPLPYLSRYQIVPVQSMLDGRVYESKSELRATYKAAGVREIGTDVDAAIKEHEARRPGKPPVTIDDVAEAYQKVRQGYKPPPLETLDQLDASDAAIGMQTDEAA